MLDRQIRTFEDIEKHLEQRRSAARRWFHQELRELEADTRRKLADESENKKNVCTEAVRQYIWLLGKAHGNRRLLRELEFVVRSQWLGWPIVEAWDGVGVPGDHWKLVTRIWVWDGPEGMFWEAKEANSIEDERLDKQEQILYYKQIELYV